jgi:L-arabinose isomerase
MSNMHPRPRIAVLALSLELYESLAPGLRQKREAWLRRDVLRALEPLGEVVFPGAVFRRDQVEAAVADFESRGVDALLVVLLTYSPSQIALPALKRTRLPILIWNTQELLSVDASFATAQMIDNHGVHGTQDLASVLVREGVRFHYVTSHLSDPDGITQVRDFLAAAAARGRLGRARLGLLGYPFPGMGDFAVDSTHLAASLGCQWVHLSVEDYINRAADAPADALATLKDEYRRSYDVSEQITDEDLEATARVELALRGMVADHRLDALTYQFMAFGDDQRSPTVPFVAASRLLADGIGFGGEGDLVGAAGSALLHWLMPPATFSEIFTIDFSGNGLFMSHMGEANVAMARPDRKVAMLVRPTPITRTRHRQLVLATTLRPGPATLFALAQGPGRRWRLIASAMEIADYGPQPMAVPHWKMLPGRDVRRFLTDYALAGGPHHNAVCFGDARQRLRMLACLLDADYIEV